ncbi:MAG TPA: DUF1846 domain-containing protein [Anaerolineaceae bacterium]|nr:DUF1846 domain-containing protein [Anaerolineaceae bacterium]
MKIGFDPQKYLKEQSEYIKERVNYYDKLYIEFGGKLYDKHATRVLPGFVETAKMEVLKSLRDRLEIIICLYSGDIERKKMRGDSNITYDMEVLRLIDDLTANKLMVNSVVITRYEDHAATNVFINKLENRNIKVYKHLATKGYPSAIDTIVSDDGYGCNPYIQTSRQIVVVTGPGPGSGKMATCLSQMYHEYRQGKQSGYSKFETFPIWNLPLKHPVNMAYEAATIDLKDIIMIDHFHVEAYNQLVVSYNRDLEAFPVLKRIIEKITGKESIYKSPTDMGVNRIGLAIIDDDVVQEAARQEVIRRYYNAQCDFKKGRIEKDSLDRILVIMDDMGLKPSDRKVVKPAIARAKRLKEEDGVEVPSAMALELGDDTIVTGKYSHLMDAGAAALLNAVKHIAHIQDDMHLISPVVLEPIKKLKTKLGGERTTSLNAKEVLIALSISAAMNPIAQVALDKLHMLKGSQAHSTTILNDEDERTFKEMGIDITSEPVFASSNLFYDM